VATAQTLEDDPTLGALSQVADLVKSAEGELRDLNGDLETMQVERAMGHSWKRIMTGAGSPNPISKLATITANLGRANGALRRAVTKALRLEGMRVESIASLFEVSRQRISALGRSDRTRS
jgi:hypothetical protein